MNADCVAEIVSEVPPEWVEHNGARDSLKSFILDRADFLADGGEVAIRNACATAQIELDV